MFSLQVRPGDWQWCTEGDGHGDTFYGTATVDQHINNWDVSSVVRAEPLLILLAANACLVFRSRYFLLPTSDLLS